MRISILSLLIFPASAIRRSDSLDPVWDSDWECGPSEFVPVKIDHMCIQHCLGNQATKMHD